jgi:hypothetical protein
MATHERLRAWQLCHKLALCVYQTTERWPRSDRLAELDYTFRLALDLKFVDEPEWKAIRDLRGAAEAITRRLYTSARKPGLKRE